MAFNNFLIEQKLPTIDHLTAVIQRLKAFLHKTNTFLRLLDILVMYQYGLLLFRLSPEENITIYQLILLNITLYPCFYLRTATHFNLNRTELGNILQNAMLTFLLFSYLDKYKLAVYFLFILFKKNGDKVSNDFPVICPHKLP